MCYGVVLTSKRSQTVAGLLVEGAGSRLENFGLDFLVTLGSFSVGRHRHSPRHVVSLFAGVSCQHHVLVFLLPAGRATAYLLCASTIRAKIPRRRPFDLASSRARRSLLSSSWQQHDRVAQPHPPSQATPHEYRRCWRDDLNRWCHRAVGFPRSAGP